MIIIPKEGIRDTSKHTIKYNQTNVWAKDIIQIEK